MSPLHRPSGEPDSRLPQDIDSLLRSFYQSQMPDPWPAFEPPTTAPDRSARILPGRVSLRSRLMLAASVLLLLLGQLALSGKFVGASSSAMDPATNRIDEATRRNSQFRPAVPQPRQGAQP